MKLADLPAREIKLAHKKAGRPAYGAYEFEKRAWVDANPDATPEQYQKAMRDLAKKCGV